MIRLLTFSSLYPNAAQPRHGIFVEERLRQLVASGEVAVSVVAPVPWFPFRHRGFGLYAVHASVAEREERYGIQIMHPRYPVLPKVGMGMAPLLMYRALLPVLKRLLSEGQSFDLIDAHYFYPDGVAAIHLGHHLGKPVVITARGTDVNLIPRYRAPRRQILWAAERAAAIVTVSQALKESLVALGVTREKITVLRNGVDLSRFRPMDRPKVRGRLGLTGPVWLSIGRLIEPKGHHLVIEALAKLRDVALLIIGEGSEEAKLKRLVDRLGISARVRFLGHIEHENLAEYYSAADVLILASSGEGMPNVVLEAMACGTPAIATAVGGIPEVISTPEAGLLAADRSAEALIKAWDKLTRRGWSREATRCHAERFSWDAVTCGQLALFEQLCCSGSLDSVGVAAHCGARHR